MTVKELVDWLNTNATPDMEIVTTRCSDLQAIEFKDFEIVDAVEKQQGAYYMRLPKRWQAQASEEDLKDMKKYVYIDGN